MFEQHAMEYLLKRQRKRTLQECRTLAVAGASPDPRSTSYVDIEKLLGLGLSIRPILPGCQRYLGLTCYANLTDVRGPVDIVLIFPDHGLDLNDLARQAREKGVAAFWIEEGVLSDDIKAILAQAKIQVVEHESLAAEYSRHFPFAVGPVAALEAKRKRTVGERMTRQPVTIKRTDGIAEALARMKAGHFRHLPVVDENGRLIGILSDRDLRLIHVSNAQAPEAIGSTLVEQAAFFDPVTISPGDTLERAAETMLRWNVGAIPVVRNGNTLTGIITYTDLLREFVAREEPGTR
jgi:CBS domain-containing protein/predicted CoA-binding protein